MHPLAVELNRTLEGTRGGRSAVRPGPPPCISPREMCRAVRRGQETREADERHDRYRVPRRPAGCYLDSIRSLDKLEPEEIFPYAPTQGLEPLRELWKQELVKKNPDLAGASFSMPLVVPGLTAGNRDAGRPVRRPRGARGAARPSVGQLPARFRDPARSRLVTFPFYAAGGGFNVAGMAAATRRRGAGGQGGPAAELPQSLPLMHLKTSRTILTLFSRLPPYSSLLLLKKGDKNWLSKYP